VLATAIAVSAGPAVAAAAPKNYCADLKGVITGQTCQIQLDDPAYTVDISFPSSYPDTKSVADYISQAATHPQCGQVVHPPGPALRAADHLDHLRVVDTAARTEGVVLKTYQNAGTAHPETPTSRSSGIRPIARRSPSTRCGRPTPTRFRSSTRSCRPTCRSRLGQPVTIPASAGLDPANYQNFAITNDGVIFFFRPGHPAARARRCHRGAGAARGDRPDAWPDPLLRQTGDRTPGSVAGRGEGRAVADGPTVASAGAIGRSGRPRPSPIPCRQSSSPGPRRTPARCAGRTERRVLQHARGLAVHRPQ